MVFNVPDIKLSGNLSIPPKAYQIKIHGTIVAAHELRLGEYLVILGEERNPDLPGDEVREPAFGMTR
jgi:flagellar biosynthesis protein FlhA